jgi:hypothetical protein
MSHGDWQSWYVFMMIMVTIIYYNRLKFFHYFAESAPFTCGDLKTILQALGHLKKKAIDLRPRDILAAPQISLHEAVASHASRTRPPTEVCEHPKMA